MTTPLAAYARTAWENYVLEDAGDCAKYDLELRHAICDGHLCDAQAGDTALVLADTIADHDRRCAPAMDQARELLGAAACFVYAETESGLTDSATVPLQTAVQRAARELLEGATVRQEGRSTVLHREECHTVITPADAEHRFPEDELMNPHPPAAPHSDHQGLPALYMAELSMWRGRWQMIVVAPGPHVVVDALDLGPADTLTVASPDGPGRHLAEPSLRPQPVPPLDDAAKRLPTAGYTIDPAAWSDPVKLNGWTQITDTYWTAPCHRAAPPA